MGGGREDGAWERQRRRGKRLLGREGRRLEGRARPPWAPRLPAKRQADGGCFSLPKRGVRGAASRGASGGWLSALFSCWAGAVARASLPGWPRPLKPEQVWPAPDQLLTPANPARRPLYLWVAATASSSHQRASGGTSHRPFPGSAGRRLPHPPVSDKETIAELMRRGAGLDLGVQPGLHLFHEPCCPPGGGKGICWFRSREDKQEASSPEPSTGGASPSPKIRDPLSVKTHEDIRKWSMESGTRAQAFQPCCVVKSTRGLG